MHPMAAYLLRTGRSATDLNGDAERGMYRETSLTLAFGLLLLGWRYPRGFDAAQETVR